MNRRHLAAPADAAPIDAVDRRLLGELQEQARLSLAELGRRVGLSSPAVAERLQRLEDWGVISGYRAELDPRALGYALTAVIRVRPAPRQLALVGDLARATEEVVECRRITGEDCYVMTAHLRSVEHLEQVVDRFAAHGQTTTSIAQSSPVPRRGMVVAAPDDADDAQNWPRVPWARARSKPSRKTTAPRGSTAAPKRAVTQSS